MKNGKSSISAETGPWRLWLWAACEGFVLLLLLRKLIWCLRWLWCWKHGRETPPPIGWLPSRDGGRFDAHVQKFDGED